MREFLIPAKGKEIPTARIPEPKPTALGLQISRGIYVEAAEEATFLSVEPAFGQSVYRVALGEESKSIEGLMGDHIHFRISVAPI